MGIDVEADIAYRCDGSGTNWPARYSTTADGFNFDMLARNGYFTRNMRPMDGKVMDTWTVGGNQFSMTVVE